MRVDPIFVPSLLDRQSEGDARDVDRLAIQITRAASTQTYETIRFLVDRDRVSNAYRAYAYFRWVDDFLDARTARVSECLDFLERQQMLVNRAYRGETLYSLSAEEEMLARLIACDTEENSGLHAYIHNLMAVMAFDANRRGRMISQGELTEYTCHLATGVTEALHYFIGHNDTTPQTAERYLAVMGAHITHMLRDTFEDADAGYFNIPCEFLNTYRLDPCDFSSAGYREWVESRVALARRYFETGKHYLAQLKSHRCRFAGYAYITCFERVLDTIERDNYRLRATYPSTKSLRSALNMTYSALSMLAKSSS